MATESQNPKTDDQTKTKYPNEEEELDEGEIVGDDESSEKSMAVIQQPHPLEHSWTFWFDHPSARSKQAKWGSSKQPIYTFSTVEKFWSLYNIIYHPSKLSVGADFYCFKQNIEPNWEDPVCANGGKWIVKFPRGKSDTCWLYTLLAMIGEQFDHGDEICGAAVNVRAKQEKIVLWTKNALNEAAQTSIGKQWKELLDYNDTIVFMVNEDAKHGRLKNRYTT